MFTYEFSKSPMLSMMLYILLGAYFSQMNVMRQAIAMSILEVAYMIMLKMGGGTENFLCTAYPVGYNVSYSCNYGIYSLDSYSLQ